MTAGPPEVLAALRREAVALARAAAPDAPPCVDPAFAADAPFRAETPQPPIFDPAALSACAALATAETAAAVAALIAAAPSLGWRRSYTVADGFAAADLANYGWFQMASPEGPFVTEGSRLVMGYWGPGFWYPEHRHRPSEIYVVLAGSAVFYAEGRAPRACVAGDVVRHAADQIHAAHATPGPLLALGLWWGADLMAPTHMVDLDLRGGAGR